MAGDLRPAKDIIKALPKGIQLRTTAQFADKLQAEQTKAAADAVTKAVNDLAALDPPLTIEDANQLVQWQEARETGRPAGP